MERYKWASATFAPDGNGVNVIREEHVLLSAALEYCKSRAKSGGKHYIYQLHSVVEFKEPEVKKVPVVTRVED
jgi:hypothetical protein